MRFQPALPPSIFIDITTNKRVVFLIVVEAGVVIERFFVKLIEANLDVCLPLAVHMIWEFFREANGSRFGRFTAKLVTSYLGFGW